MQIGWRNGLRQVLMSYNSPNQPIHLLIFSTFRVVASRANRKRRASISAVAGSTWGRREPRPCKCWTYSFKETHMITWTVPNQNNGNPSRVLSYLRRGKRVKKWRCEKEKEWRVSSPCHSRLSAYVLSAVYIPSEPRREREWTRFSAWVNSLKLLLGINGVCQTAWCHVTAGLLASVTNSTFSSKKRSERAQLRKSNYFTFFLLWKRGIGITAPKTRVNSISRLS